MASNIYISKEDYEAAKNYLMQFLRDSGFIGSLEDGTALHDVVVKAFALMYTLYKRETQKVSAYLSLDKAKEMGTLIGADYDEAVDSILSNWFVQRKDGTKTTGVVRMWFSKPLEFYSVAPGTQISVSEGIPFEPSSLQVFTENDFVGVMNTASNVTEYYIEVAITSQTNTDVKPMSGSVIYSFPSNIYYLRSEVTNDFTPGIAKESSEDFVRRTQKAITTRELITERAISTVLTDEFSTIYNVYVAGYGDVEQLRDIVDFNGVIAHIGNKADIYVCTEFSFAEGVAPADINGNVLVNSLGANATVTHVLSTKIVRDNVETDALFTYVSCSETLWGSATGDLVINIPSAQNNDLIKIRYITCAVLPLVKSFIINSDNRVACYDPLVKSKYPVVTSFSLQLRVGPSVDRDPLTKLVKQAVLAYLKEIAKNETTYKASELVAAIHAVSEEVLAITIPIQAQYVVFDPKSHTNKTGSLPMYATADSFGVSTLQFTDNTMQLFSDESFITVSYI